MTEIIITLECHKCKTVMKSNLFNPSGNEFSLTSFIQHIFVCPKCGLEHYTGEGDINIFADNGRRRRLSNYK